MTTKTNYHMLRELKFKAEHFGWLNEKEAEFLRNYFQLDKRSNIDLQNLRDFVVMYFSGKTRDNLETADLLSGIVGIIDEEKVNRGLEI